MLIGLIVFHDYKVQGYCYCEECKVNRLLDSYSNFCLVINLQFDFVDKDGNQIAHTKFLIKTI